MYSFYNPAYCQKKLMIMLERWPHVLADPSALASHSILNDAAFIVLYHEHLAKRFNVRDTM